MWFVQQLHEQMVLLEFSESQILRDRRPAPEVRDGESCASPYCDNLGVIGSLPSEVLELREAVRQGLEQQGFAMHEETAAEPDATILGGRFHGECNIISASAKRYTRVQKACLWVSRRPRLTGREVERLGHAIYLSLLQRVSLGVFCHVYGFTDQVCSI